MNLSVFDILLGLFLALAVANLISATFVKEPNSFNRLSALIAVGGLIVQLATTVVVLVGGEPACRGSIWEFFGYLLVAFVVPLAALFWSLIEKTRQSVLILSLAPLVLAIMLYRMLVIWGV